MREQLKLISLTWEYYICHCSLGVVGGRLAAYFSALSRSAKPQLPKMLNAFDEIRIQN